MSRNNWGVYLYNDYGETVLYTTNYKDVQNFLGRSYAGVTTAVHRAKNGIVSNIYDSQGKKYKIEVMEEEQIADYREIIENAKKYIYESGLLEKKCECSKYFIELLDILEGEII